MSNNKYFIKKYVPIYKADNKICIGYPNKNEYIEIDYNEDNYFQLEQFLKYGISEKLLLKSFFQEMYNKDFLQSKPVIFESYKNSRSELFFEYLLKSSVSDKLLKIKEKKILIFGAGAGGSSLIYLLAQFGFKNITVIDYDVIEETDIQRISIFDKEDIGKRKITALKNKIKRNFSININTIDAKLIQEKEISDIINLIEPKIIVKACDPAGAFLMNLNRVCFKCKIPYISMAYSFERLKIGPLLIPDVTSCAEFLSQAAVDYYGNHYKIEKFEKLFSNYTFHPSISYNINILASLVFKEIVFFLLEAFDYCQTIGRILTFNPLDLSVTPFLVKCEDSCELCYYENKKI